MQTRKLKDDNNREYSVLDFGMPRNEDEFNDLLSKCCDRFLVEHASRTDLSLALIDMGFVIALESDQVIDLEILKSRIKENMDVVNNLISYRKKAN